MSRENVEVVRRGWEAITSRDMHAFLDLFDAEVEATSRLMQAEGTVYRGREGMRQLMEDLFSVFPDFRGEVEAARELGDVVLAEVRVGGRAVESGVSVTTVGWQLIEFRDGKIVRISGYATEAEALEAAGLRE